MKLNGCYSENIIWLYYCSSCANERSFWINRNVFLCENKNADLQDWIYLVQWDMESAMYYLIAVLVSNLPYGCQEHYIPTTMSRYYIPLYVQ